MHILRRWVYVKTLDDGVNSTGLSGCVERIIFPQPHLLVLLGEVCLLQSTLMNNLLEDVSTKVWEGPGWWGGRG